MKRLLIGTLLFVPLLATAAHAQTTDEWVDAYTSDDEETQDSWEFSQDTSSGDEADESQNAQANQRQQGPTFVEDSESNDDSDVSGVSVLPIVGNDILNNADILSNVANDYSQRDDSRTTINQSRREDNDRVSITDDSFNVGERAPVVVLQPRTSRVVQVSDGGGAKLPTTGFSFMWPLALGIWLVTAGAWMVRRAGGRVLSFGLST